MSLWNYVFDSQWMQRSDIEQLKKSTWRRQLSSSRISSRQKKKMVSLEERIEELEDNLGQVTLFLLSSMEMLKQSNNWDDDKFKEAMDMIDGKDGIQDGKASLET